MIFPPNKRMTGLGLYGNDGQTRIRIRPYKM
jgi:hypothetical protein